jgi:hypothetical protein
MALMAKVCKNIELLKVDAFVADKKTNSIYDTNRPVHLARSYVFIEKARRQFQEGVGNGVSKQCVHAIDGSLYYLFSALEHASLAAKSTKTNPLEQSFVAFLRMMVTCLYSARLLLESEFQLADQQSLLWQFLHQRGKKQEAIKFARSGEQLLADVAHLFKVSQEAIDDLRQSLLDSMDEDERSRYKLSYDNLRTHLAHSHRTSRLERFFQIFWPTLGTKSE